MSREDQGKFTVMHLQGVLHVLRYLSIRFFLNQNKTQHHLYNVYRLSGYFFREFVRDVWGDYFHTCAELFLFLNKNQYEIQIFLSTQCSGKQVYHEQAEEKKLFHMQLEGPSVDQELSHLHWRSHHKSTLHKGLYLLRKMVSKQECCQKHTQ